MKAFIQIPIELKSQKKGLVIHGPMSDMDNTLIDFCENTVKDKIILLDENKIPIGEAAKVDIKIYNAIIKGKHYNL